MILTAKLLPLIYNTLKSPKDVVLTLALTSLLSSGIGLGGNNSAAAFPGSENMSGESISQLSDLPQQSNRLPRAIALRILRDAQQRSSIPIRELQITQVTPRTFSNPCIFKFGEVCTKEYNPIEGWEVVVQVQKQSWTYHVDQSGSQIVLDPISTSNSTALPEEIQDAILQDASDRSGVAIADLQITQVTEKTFSNPCVFKFGEICTLEYNPVKGWEVVVQVQEQAWIYHVDESGSQIVLDPKVSQ